MIKRILFGALALCFSLSLQRSTLAQGLSSDGSTLTLPAGSPVTVVQSSGNRSRSSAPDAGAPDASMSGSSTDGIQPDSLDNFGQSLPKTGGEPGLMVAGGMLLMMASVALMLKNKRSAEIK